MQVILSALLLWQPVTSHAEAADSRSEAVSVSVEVAMCSSGQCWRDAKDSPNLVIAPKVIENGIDQTLNSSAESPRRDQPGAAQPESPKGR